MKTIIVKIRCKVVQDIVQGKENYKIYLPKFKEGKEIEVKFR